MPTNRKPWIDPAEVPKAHRIRWWVAAVFVGLFAVILMVLPYVGPLWRRLEVAQAAVTNVVTWTIVQSAGIVTALVLTLYFVGKARLERAAYRADHIDIGAFGDERKADDADRELHSAAELTARFKHILNNSRLYTPTPVPGVGGSYDFIQIVENAGAAGDGLWKVATKLIKLASPPAAFRISGTIRPGAGNGRHQLILELVRVPRFAASPLVIEDDSWMRVLHRAANAVSALVLPRSKYGKENTYWAAWRNAKIPYELFDAYQRANHLVKNRRYDEALGEYHRALGYDPSNVYIRLEIASVLEQLDLHLDALATYDDVITLCSRGHPRLARWWQVEPDSRRWSRRARRTRKQQDVALLVARYRHALVLGLGDSVANSWWTCLPKAGVDPASDVRVRRRATLRTAIAMRFHRYRKLKVVPGQERVHDTVLDTAVQELVRAPENEARQHTYQERAIQLRSYFGALSQYEIELLLADCRRFRLVHWLRWRRLSEVLPFHALEVSLVWISLRRAMADIKPKTAIVPIRKLIIPVRVRRPRLLDVFPYGTWPPDPDKLAEAVRAASGRRHRRSWSECYNAACVYSVAMLRVGPRGSPDPRCRDDEQPTLVSDGRDKAARLAVDELYHATMASHSGSLTTHRSWVMDEDPDLAALREHELFRVFEMVTFAPDQPTPLRPIRSHVWEQASYLRQLVGDMAGCRAQFWRGRAMAGAEFDEHIVAGWRAADRAAWQELRALAVSRQDWRTRYEAILAYRRWASEAGIPATVPSFPSYCDTLLSTQYTSYFGCPPDKPLIDSDTVNTAAMRYVTGCDARLDELVTSMAPLLHLMPATNHLPGHATAILDGQRGEFTQLAERWAALAAWFDDCATNDLSASGRGQAFSAPLRQHAGDAQPR